MAAVLGPVYSVGQQVLARPGAAIAQQGTIEQRTITILEVLPGDRYRVAYHDVTNLIVRGSILQPVSPTARSTDPATSHAAARNAAKPWKLYAGQRRALHAIVMAGDRGLNDFELADRTGTKQTSIGVRRGEIATGVPHGTLSKLMYGDRARGMGPSKRIRPVTMEKILAVTPAAVAGGAKIPAGPTWVLLEEMIAAGVPKAQIAEQIPGHGRTLQLSRNLVAARNARAVADLHRRWKAGDWIPERRHKHGTRPIPAPHPVEPPRRRPAVDVSDLLLELAEIVEERNAQPWRASAACRGRPAWMWFPARGDNETLTRALKVCRSCMVRDQCRAANIDKREGVYGALTAKARRDLRSAAA